MSAAVPLLSRRSWLAAAFGAVGALTFAPEAAAGSSNVTITDVEVPEGPEAKRLTKLVRRQLVSSAKRAKFGKATKVRISVKVTELEMVDHGDVLKVRCTMVGRIEGGRTAKSRLEFGGRPEREKELQKKVLGMVGDGLMTRLAQMARDRAE